MAIGLVLQVLHVRMDQTENEERVEEKVQADGSRHKRTEAQANQGSFI
jgi:hypothetical protein